jgi:hypothetical protein
MTADMDAAKECQEEKLKDVLREYFPKNLCNADKTTF